MSRMEAQREALPMEASGVQRLQAETTVKITGQAAAELDPVLRHPRPRLQRRMIRYCQPSRSVIILMM